MKHFLFFVAVFLLSSCAANHRIVEQHHTYADTVSVVFSDTTHYLSFRDTTIVTHREFITEHIINLYDNSGNLSQQEIDRHIMRSADSISSHRIDSLLHVISELRSSASSVTDDNREEIIPVSIPWYKRMMYNVSSLIFLLAIIAIVFASVKYYNKHNK